MRHKKNEFSVNVDLDIAASFIAEPIISPTGNIIAMEMLSRFFLCHDQKRKQLPSEEFYRKSSIKIKRGLFLRQIEMIKIESSIFKENNIICTVNVDEDIAKFICCTSSIKSLLITMPFIRLEISETFPDMGKLTRVPLLSRLSDNFGLWLDDFGNGNANLAALHNSGLFDTVKIDKHFFWEHHGSSLWDVTLRELRRFTTSLVVEGVETQSQMRRLETSVEGLQGYLFPSVPLDDHQALLTVAGKPTGQHNIYTTPRIYQEKR